MFVRAILVAKTQPAKQCLSCGGELRITAQGTSCTQCGRQYPTVQDRSGRKL